MGSAILPASVLWRGRLSDNPANRLDNVYRVPVGWRGRIVDIHAAPTTPTPEVEPGPFIAAGGAPLGLPSDTTLYSAPYPATPWSVSQQIGYIGGNAVSSIAVGLSRVVAIYANVSSSFSRVSHDGGLTWGDQFDFDTGIVLLSVAWTGRYFVAVGYETSSGSGIAIRSLDGVSWNQVSTLPGGLFPMRSVCYARGKLVAVGDMGGGVQPEIMVSTDDGATWTAGTLTPWTGGDLYAVTAPKVATGNFVAVGENGFPAYSADGLTWTEGVGVPDDLYAVVAVERPGNAFPVVYVAGGKVDYVVSLDGGATWSATAFRPGSPSDEIYSLAWNAGYMLAGTDQGEIYRNADPEGAVAWTLVASGLFSVGALAGSYPLFTAGGLYAGLGGRPYFDLKRSSGQRMATSDSAPLYIATSPGWNGPGALGAVLQRSQLEGGGRFYGWLLGGGDTLEMSLDYQKNNFKGEVDFVVRMEFGLVESL